MFPSIREAAGSPRRWFDRASAGRRGARAQAPPLAERAGALKPRAAPDPANPQSPPPAVPAAPDSSGSPAAAAPPPHYTHPKLSPLVPCANITFPYGHMSSFFSSPVAAPPTAQSLALTALSQAAGTTG